MYFLLGFVPVAAFLSCILFTEAETWQRFLGIIAAIIAMLAAETYVLFPALRHAKADENHIIIMSSVFTQPEVILCGAGMACSFVLHLLYSAYVNRRPVR